MRWRPGCVHAGAVCLLRPAVPGSLGTWGPARHTALPPHCQYSGGCLWELWAQPYRQLRVLCSQVREKMAPRWVCGRLGPAPIEPTPPPSPQRCHLRAAAVPGGHGPASAGLSPGSALGDPGSQWNPDKLQLGTPGPGPRRGPAPPDSTWHSLWPWPGEQPGWVSPGGEGYLCTGEQCPDLTVYGAQTLRGVHVVTEHSPVVPQALVSPSVTLGCGLSCVGLQRQEAL